MLQLTTTEQEFLAWAFMSRLSGVHDDDPDDLIAIWNIREPYRQLNGAELRRIADFYKSINDRHKAERRSDFHP
jgi:hypothetical protein